MEKRNNSAFAKNVRQMIKDKAFNFTPSQRASSSDDSSSDGSEGTPIKYQEILKSNREMGTNQIFQTFDTVRSEVSQAQ